MEFYKAEPTCTYTTFRNPVAPSGADPWVIRDDETGKYYYCYSGGNGVCVNEIESLDKITSEGGTKVYTAPQGTMYHRGMFFRKRHDSCIAEVRPLQSFLLRLRSQSIRIS